MRSEIGHLSSRSSPTRSRVHLASAPIPSPTTCGPPPFSWTGRCAPALVESRF